MEIRDRGTTTLRNEWNGMERNGMECILPVRYPMECNGMQREIDEMPSIKTLLTHDRRSFLPHKVFVHEGRSLPGLGR